MCVTVTVVFVYACMHGYSELVIYACLRWSSSLLRVRTVVTVTVVTVTVVFVWAYSELI